MRNAATQVMNDTMAKAAGQEYEMADPVDDDARRNVDVSCDGTWVTRGHSPKVGAASVIGCATGKVVGMGTRSKVCKSCEYWDNADKNSEKYRHWQANHAPNCTHNHDGIIGCDGKGDGERNILFFCTRPQTQVHQVHR